MEEVEKLLLIWINEKELYGDSISEGIICEKALCMHGELLKETPGQVQKVKVGLLSKMERRPVQTKKQP